MSVFRRLSDALRKTQNKRKEGRKRETQKMEQRGTDGRNEREGQKAKKCVRRPRKKHDTAGPDLEALWKAISLIRADVHGSYSALC